MITCKLSDLQARCRERGYTLDEVRPCIIYQDRDLITVDETHTSYPHPRKGPGTKLKAILKEWLGIESSPTCSCNAMAHKMDKLGVDWCESEEGLTEIVGVMRTEHNKRWTAGLTKLPWIDIGARQLIKLACRQARTQI